MATAAAPSLYDRDFALWAKEQSAALRAGRLRDLDLANLIDEVEDLARRQRRAILSRLTKIQLHLLKLRHQPERASRSWLSTIVTQATKIRRVLNDSPSLRRELAGFASEAYSDARKLAQVETGLPIETFPIEPTPEFTADLRAALNGEDFGGEAIVRRP